MTDRIRYRRDPPGDDPDRRPSFEESLLLVLGVVLQSIPNLYNFSVNSPPIIGLDAIVFQYSGWYMTQGGVPYAGIWDIKPPFIHYVAAAVSAISGGDMFVLHTASVLLMGASFLLVSSLVFRIVIELTDNRRSAFLASLFLFTYPELYTFSARGLRPKMFVMLFALVSIWCLTRERFAMSALFGALAAGFWQFAIVFALVPTAYVIHRREWKSFTALLVGTSALVAVAVAPLAYSGVTNQLVAEVIVGPFMASEELNYPLRILEAGYFLKFASIPLAIGGLGVLVAVREDAYGRPLWLPILGGWFLFQVLFIDLDGPPDLFVGFVIAALGLGIAADHWPRYERTLLVGTSAVVVLMCGWLTYVLVTGDTFLWPGFSATLVADPSGYYSYTAGLDHLYWNREFAGSCHLRLSEPEKDFMRIVGETRETARCGAYDLRHLIRAIVG